MQTVKNFAIRKRISCIYIYMYVYSMCLVNTFNLNSKYVLEHGKLLLNWHSVSYIFGVHSIPNVNTRKETWINNYTDKRRRYVPQQSTIYRRICGGISFLLFPGVANFSFGLIRDANDKQHANVHSGQRNVVATRVIPVEINRNRLVSYAKQE